MLTNLEGTATNGAVFIFFQAQVIFHFQGVGGHVKLGAPAGASGQRSCSTFFLLTTDTLFAKGEKRTMSWFANSLLIPWKISLFANFPLRGHCSGASGSCIYQTAERQGRVLRALACIT